MTTPSTGTIHLATGEVEEITVQVGTGTVVRGKLPIANQIAEGCRASLRLFRVKPTKYGTMWAEDLPGGVRTKRDGRFEFDAKPGEAFLSGYWLEPGNNIYVCQVSLMIERGLNELGELPLELTPPVEVRERFRVGEQVFTRDQVYRTDPIPEEWKSQDWGLFSIEVRGGPRKFSETPTVDPNEPIYLFGLYPGVTWHVGYMFSDHLGQLQDQYMAVGNTPTQEFQLPRTSPVDIVWNLQHAVKGVLILDVEAKGFTGRIDIDPLSKGPNPSPGRGTHLRLEAGQKQEFRLPVGRYGYVMVPDFGVNERRSFTARGEFELRSDGQVIEVVGQPGASLVGHSNSSRQLQVKFHVSHEGESYDYEYLWRVDGDFVLSGLPLFTDIIIDKQVVRSGGANSEVEIVLDS